MRRTAPVGVFLAVFLSAGLARADLATGRDKLIAGDYKAAMAELGKVSGKDRAAARLLLAEAQTVLGDYPAAEATAAALVKDKDPKVAAAARVRVARIQRLTGRAAAARADLEALVKSAPDDRAARHLLAVIAYEAGDLVGAKKLFQLSMDEFDAKKIDLEDGAQLYYLAEAARYTAQFAFANDSYHAATSKDPTFIEAGLAWADLFSRKYAAELAEQTLEEVFKVNPNHPDAHAAMAAVVLDNRYDLPAVQSHLDKALALNPKNERALLVRASVQIDQNQWDAAKATLDQALAVNPQSAEALSLLATIAWLRDNTAEYEAARKKVLAVNPAYARMYELIGRSAVREHRYVEAIELEKQAVALVPDDYEAMAEIGMGYLRLGEEKAGLVWLDKAWSGDQYNVRTKNTLELFEETIPKDYTFKDGPIFRFRLPREEAPVLDRYIRPTLEAAFKDMVTRYGFTPKTPVVIELYTERDDYSIRTVGLPDLGALGVCFGQVITALSPSNGDINWGMVLWHELAHVFAIQLSNSRVPRWFTEGLSEYETLIHDPTWRRENDSDVYGAVANGTLPSVATLNYEFMQPDQQGVIVAYFLSAVTVEYIAQTYGFPKIVEALKAFGKGKETPEVIQLITGKTVAQFDKDFRAYLDLRLAPWKGTFRLPTRGYDDLTALEIARDAAPKDAAKAAAVALGNYYAGDAEATIAAARAALALDSKQPIARYVLAEALLRAGDGDGAKVLYLGLINDGHDSFDVRARLAQIAASAKDQAGVEKQLCAAKKLNPESSFPYDELKNLYQKTHRDAQALVELEHYVFLEQMQLAPLKELMDGYGAQNRWDKVRTYGEMATFVNPADPGVLMGLARAYLELKDGQKALFTYDTALLVTPPPRRPALAHIGRARAYLLLGQKPKAKQALQQAIKTEPENAEVVELKKLL